MRKARWCSRSRYARRLLRFEDLESRLPVSEGFGASIAVSDLALGDALASLQPSVAESQIGMIGDAMLSDVVESDGAVSPRSAGAVALVDERESVSILLPPSQPDDTNALDEDLDLMSSLQEGMLVDASGLLPGIDEAIERPGPALDDQADASSSDPDEAAFPAATSQGAGAGPTGATPISVDAAQQRQQPQQISDSGETDDAGHLAQPTPQSGDRITIKSHSGGGGQGGGCEIQVQINGAGIDPEHPQVSVIGGGHQLSAMINEDCGHSPISYDWFVPNLKNYTQTEEEGKVTYLTAADLDDPTVGFHWDGGDKGSKSVSVAISWDDGSTTIHNGYFDVKAPTLHSFTSQTGTIAVDPSGFAGPNDIELHFGYTQGFGDSKPGIQWFADVENQTGYAGRLQFTQLGDVQREVTDGNGTLHIKATNGFQLDQRVSYADQLVPNGTRTQAPDEFTSRDDPGQGVLPTDQRVFVVELYDLYLMWHPVLPFGLPPIFVTIGKLQWDWTGEAVNQNGNWNLVPGSADATPNPAGAAETAFPEWEGGTIQTVPFVPPL